MKRVLSLCISLLMLLGLAIPALAEAPPADGQAAMEQTLSQVTLQVKETLQVDDGYTDFYSDYYDGPTPRWSLNWSDDSRSLSVETNPEGKILNVYRWTNRDSYDRFYGFDPAFPPLTRDEAESQAQTWLARLMGPDETGRIDTVRTYLGSDGYYRLYGTVLLNNLESPVTFSMQIDGQGLASYYRSDEFAAYVGDISPENPLVDTKVGGDGLFDAISMELYYVTDEDGTARLRYVPVGPYTVVDALTGQAVDMDALYASFESGATGRGYNNAVAMESEAAADAGGAAPAAALTEVELTSIASYGNVMDQEAIDGLLKSMPALGLAGFQVQRCSYAMDSATGEVTASLRYTGEMTLENLYGYSFEAFAQFQSWGDPLTIYKYITVNASTGTLMDVSTNYPLWETDESTWMSQQTRQAAAESFLQEAAPELFSESGLCTLTGYDRESVYTYAQVHAGYFYPENYLQVEINPAAGTVDRFSYTWDEDTVFAPAAGIVTEDQAVRAYAGALDVTLGYAAWPVDIQKEDPVLYARYLEWGYTFVETLRLGYYYSGLEDVAGVDALNGETVRSAVSDGTFVYDDLAGEPRADKINALAQAGIGFAGGSFSPAAALTQRDAVTLLLQADGYQTADWDDDTLQSEAVWQGFLTGLEWSPETVVTGMDFIHMLLGASRYGDAAALLSGVSGEAGYTAIAQAMGMDVTDPDRPLTRADGAELLYIFMSR